MRPLAALIRKEFIQFFRHKPLVILVVWTIAIEIAICAYAITYDLARIPVAVEDRDASPLSRELVARFERTEAFDVRYRVWRRDEMDRLLGSGRATLGLAIPDDFADALVQGRQPAVQLLLDGSNSNTALIALGYAERIVGRFARDAARQRAERVLGAVGPIPRVESRARAWFDPDLRSVHFVVVAMLVLGVTMIAVVHPAAAVAWEKEAGTNEQLLVMPFRTWELMLAKVAPTFAVSLGSLALALWVPWAFGVPIRGSLALFFALSAVFLFGGSGLGLLCGALAENLQQALLLAFFVIFPLFVISGTLVPVESMPAAIQAVAALSPLRYYLEIGLGIFLKGVGMEVLWWPTLMMAALGLGLFGLGLWAFGRRLG